MDPNDKKFASPSCAVCGKQFYSEKSYFGHLRIHSDQVQGRSDGIPSSGVFSDSPSKLTATENSSPPAARPHECSKCKSTFDRPSQLDYHRRSVHIGEKSQICQICGRGFFRKTDLKTHLNVHLGTNQSICEVCGRKFNHVSNLIRHCRTHAGSKPYPCTICGKRFTQISSLARHKRIHERECKDFSQSEKNGERGSEESLENLEDLPEADTKSRRQHYCRVCGESFRFMVLLRKHKRIHAKILETRAEKASERIDDWRNMEEGKMTIYNEQNSREQYSTNNCILMELAKRVNTMEIENERDVSISDILSPYNCNEIELPNGHNSETKLYEDSFKNKETLGKDYDIVECLNSVDFESNVVSESSTTKEAPESTFQNSGMEKSRCTSGTLCGESFPVGKGYLEIRGSDCLETSSTENSNPEEFNGVREPREMDFDSTDERTKSERISEEKLHQKSDDKARENEDGIDLQSGEPRLRLVKTETGEQFYELVVNNRCDDFENLFIENNEQLKSPAEETLEHEKSSISRHDIQSLGEETVGKAAIDDSSEFIQFLPNIENSRDIQNSMGNDYDFQVPMVRLVQNEDGEQFFELVREPLEFEENRDSDKNYENSQTSSPNIDNSSISKDETIKKVVVTPGAKRERKDLLTEHGQKVAKDRSRKFRCNECDKWFSTAYNFKQHAGTHFSDQQKFHCKECGLSFAWKSTLNKHLAGNHRPDGPQKFVCEICPKVYSTLSQVNEHVKRDHLKERNHVCTFCGKSFFKKFDLKTHSRTHTNERPYICRACGKGFHHQSHIIRHERIHSGERPYECNICRKTFTQPGSLKSHRQRHRDIKIDILEYRMDEDDPLTLAV